MLHNHPVSQITEILFKTGWPNKHENMNKNERVCTKKVDMTSNVWHPYYTNYKKKTTLSCLFGHPVFISNRTMLLCLSIMLMTRKNKINVNNKTNKRLT